MDTHRATISLDAGRSVFFIPTWGDVLSIKGRFHQRLAHYFALQIAGT
jgi:hypothetical protein